MQEVSGYGLRVNRGLAENSPCRAVAQVFPCPGLSIADYDARRVHFGSTADQAAPQDS